MSSLRKHALITIGSAFVFALPAYSQVGSMGLCGTGGASISGTAEIDSADVGIAKVSGAADTLGVGEGRRT